MPPTDHDPVDALVDAVDALLEAPSYAASLHVLDHIRDLVEECAAHDLLALAEGRTQAQVADELHVSQQAVAQRLARARRRLERTPEPFTFARRAADGSIEIRVRGGGS